MTDRVSIVAFALSILGAGYQMVSYEIAYFVDKSSTYYLFLSFYDLTLVMNLVVFYAAGHFIGSQANKSAAWPSMILAIGAANLGNLIAEYFTPVNNGILQTVSVPVGVLLALIPAPLLLIVGSLLGFVAVRRSHP